MSEELTEQEAEAALAARCLYCNEPIVPGDSVRPMACIDADGAAVAKVAHRECLFASVLGHLYGVCDCFELPPGKTKRQAAREAMKQAGLWREVN